LPMTTKIARSDAFIIFLGAAYLNALKLINFEITL